MVLYFSPPTYEDEDELATTTTKKTLMTNLALMGGVDSFSYFLGISNQRGMYFECTKLKGVMFMVVYVIPKLLRNGASLFQENFYDFL